LPTALNWRGKVIKLEAQQQALMAVVYDIRVMPKMLTS